ncbi:MAG: hypothetical protein ACP5O3_00085 [Candidatus Micrarchaeia archaeon]
MVLVAVNQILKEKLVVPDKRAQEITGKPIHQTAFPTIKTLLPVVRPEELKSASLAGFVESKEKVARLIALLEERGLHKRRQGAIVWMGHKTDHGFPVKIEFVGRVEPEKLLRQWYSEEVARKWFK